VRRTLLLVLAAACAEPRAAEAPPPCAAIVRLMTAGAATCGAGGETPFHERVAATRRALDGAPCLRALARTGDAVAVVLLAERPQAELEALAADPDPAVRAAAARAAGRARRAHVVTAALADPSPAVRVAALAAAAAFTGDARLIAAVLPLLADEAPAVRAAAASCLALQGATAARPRVAALQGDPDQEVRVRATYAARQLAR
jgi:HEAT repeat protein